MTPIEFVKRFADANDERVFSAAETTEAINQRLIGTHGPGETYQLTELGLALLEGAAEGWALGAARQQTPTTAKDVQIGGDHYKKLGQYQPWEVLAIWMTPEELRGYMKGTVIAYLAREQDKGGDSDVAKALHTMQLWQEVRKDK